MKSLISLSKRLVRDESGTELIEYVMLLGLIFLAALFVVTGLGTKVIAKWTSIDWSL
jgi:Flp pilus assembly pilin Flp